MADLFPETKLPRKRPQKLMHVYDAGHDGMVRMECGHCGHDDGWKMYPDKSVSELKRGLPCPVCNQKRRLYLHVKRCYFDDVRAGRKPFEFRLDNEYWRKKLEGVDYDELVYMAGYPPAGDTENTMILPYRGYEKQNITHEHFGNVPKCVFAIKMEVENVAI